MCFGGKIIRRRQARHIHHLSTTRMKCVYFMCEAEKSVCDVGGDFSEAAAFNQAELVSLLRASMSVTGSVKCTFQDGRHRFQRAHNIYALKYYVV